MHSPLETLFSGIGLVPGPALGHEDARAIVAAASLLVLCDEILTPAETSGLMDELERSWGLTLKKEGLEILFDRLSAAPFNRIRRAIAEQVSCWPREQAVRLLETLASIARSDRRISQSERLFLADFAKLAGDAEIAAGLVPDGRHSSGSGDLAELLLVDGKEVYLGRSLASDIRLLRAPIAARQASFRLCGQVVEVVDLGREKQLVHAGRPLAAPLELQDGEAVEVGRYRIRFDARLPGLAIGLRDGASELVARQVVVNVPGRRGPRALVRGVDLQARAGEMIAIIGPSGCGKSTLLGALAGIHPIQGGAVSLDGTPVEPGVQATTRRISFVPQDDLVHSSLTVEEAVSIAAKLKGLGARGGAPLEVWVSEILEQLNLSQQEVRQTQVGDNVNRGISGGQRKRVGVAQELVGDDTDVLILDEPTSGLDPRNEQKIVEILRAIAKSGKIVIVTTHGVFDGNLGQFDQVLCLTAHGKAAYFGPPAELLGHFGAADIDGVFLHLEKADVGSGWAAPLLPAGAGQSSDDARERPVGWGRRLAILCGRHFKIRARDRAGAVLALAFPLAVVLVLRLIYLPGCLEGTSLFVIGLASLWAGISFTVRDILSEFAILRHEVRSRTTVLSAYASKVAVAGLVCGIQALLLTLVVFPAFRLRNVYEFSGWRVDPASLLGQSILSKIGLVSFWHLLLALFVAGLVGNSLGLLLSALFRTAESAIFMIPLLVLPMIAAAGVLVSPKNFSEVLRPALAANPLYWIYSGLLASSANSCKPYSDFVPGDLERELATKTKVCSGVDFRTVSSPAAGGRAFVQDQEPCIFNQFVPIGEFYESIGMGWEAPRDAAGEIDGEPTRQLHAAAYRRALGALLASAAIFHLAALAAIQRRLFGKVWPF